MTWRVVSAWSSRPLKYADFNPYAKRTDPAEDYDAAFAAFVKTLAGTRPGEALERMRAYNGGK